MTHRSLTESLSVGAAPAIDAALTTLGQFPGFSVALGLLQGFDDFRARSMAAKLASFLEGMERQLPDAIKAIDKKLDDPASREMVSEAVLLTIERYTSLKKCELVGRLFRQYMKGVIDSTVLRRLVAAIDAAFIDDLEAYLADAYSVVLEQKPYQALLVGAGLMELIQSGSIGGPAARMYRATPLGVALKSVLVAPPRSLAEMSKGNTPAPSST